MKRLIIWGAGNQAIVAASLIRLQGEYEIAGFLDNVDLTRRGSSFYGGVILGGAEQLPTLRESGIEYAVLAFGNCAARLRCAEQVISIGFQLITLIHPHASVAPDAIIGAGTLIKAGAIIDPNVQIGANVIIGAGATVAHGCVLADGSRLSGGANLAGNVGVGRGAWIAAGATIKDHVTIGAGSLIGAGAVVVQDVPPNCVAYGVPARVIRPTHTDEV